MRVTWVNILENLKFRQFRFKYCEGEKNDQKGQPLLFCLAVENKS